MYAINHKWLHSIDKSGCVKVTYLGDISRD